MVSRPFLFPQAHHMHTRLSSVYKQVDVGRIKYPAAERILTSETLEPGQEPIIQSLRARHTAASSSHLQNRRSRTDPYRSVERGKGKQETTKPVPSNQSSRRLQRYPRFPVIYVAAQRKVPSTSYPALSARQSADRILLQTTDCLRSQPTKQDILHNRVDWPPLACFLAVLRVRWL